MAKLTKNDLKDIVKECLVEILAEGLVSNTTSQIASSRKSSKLMEQVSKSSRTRNSQKKSSKNFKKPGYLDNISFDKRAENENQSKLNSIAEAAKKITKDPIMSEMLADTAQTTLQEQFAAESKSGFVPSGVGDAAQKTVEKNSPEDLFGNEAAGKWASLAFGS